MVLKRADASAGQDGQNTHFLLQDSLRLVQVAVGSADREDCEARRLRVAGAGTLDGPEW